MPPRLVQWFRNLRIQHKLVLGFGLLVMLMAIAVAASLWSNDATDDANTRVHEAYEQALLAEQLRSSVWTADAKIKQGTLAYLSRGPEEALVPLAEAQQAIDDSQRLVGAIEAGNPTANALPLVEQVQADIRALEADLTEGVVAHIENRGDRNTGKLGATIAEITDIETQLDSAAYPEIAAAIDDLKEAVAVFLPDPENAAASFQQIDGQVESLRAEIENADFPAAEKDALIAEFEEAASAIQTFVASDMLVGFAFLQIMDNTEAISTAVSEFVALQLQAQASVQQDAEAVQRQALMTQYLSAALAVLLALIFSGIISRSVSRPMQTLTEVTQDIAAGDYTKRTGITTRDETGQLAQSIDTMVSVIQQRETDLRDQTSRLRVATAKAREAARVKGEFMANISHELRTPLNAIIGFSDILLMGMAGELSEKQHHQIERLRANGQRLLDLVNDILDLARIEAQRVELVTKPFKPRDLADRLAKQVEPLAADRDLHFTTTVDADVPETLVGDVQRVEQVVLNLLSNAFKFTEQGHVTLRVSADLSTRQWKVAVQDTGVGIPPHALDLIFEEFRQVDGSSTRAYQGSGLGLAISRNLVRIMEGQITVESEPGKGSTFTVTLPLVLSASPQDVPASEEVAVKPLEV
jgi:signal transduction histidine kinase